MVDEHVPAFDVQAERAVLSAILAAPDVIVDVLDEMAGVDFYEPRHEVVFNALVSMFTSGSPIDAVLLHAELERSGMLARVGASFVVELVGVFDLPANAPAYAARVHELAVRRRLAGAGVAITQRANSGVGDLEALRDAAERELLSAVGDTTSSSVTSAAELPEIALAQARAAAASPSGTVGVRSGLKDLDKLTGGFAPGQMVIIAARPGVGKSMLALNIARQAAINDRVSTLFFSLEMSTTEVALRLMAAEGSVALNSLTNGDPVMSQSDWQRLSDIEEKVTSAPLSIDDSTGMSMMLIRSAARRYAMRNNLGLVIIDYVQLIVTPGKRPESRQVEVAEMSRQAKLLARELDIPVVCCAQLNRNSEARADRRPALADLRESGSLEQDADIVILLHRPDLISPDSGRAGEADMIVAKNRAGRTGVTHCVFQGHYSRFVDMASM
jgi:replicative DNA helicase